MSHPFAVLDVVTDVLQEDGTYQEKRLSILDGANGIWLMDWDPSVLNYKDGGTIVNSPLAEGRIPVQTVWDDVSETYTLGFSGTIQNNTIRSFRRLGDLLVKSVEYWTSWSEQMVWLEAKAACETEKRYALIKIWSMPGHNNPYQNPFTGNTRESALANVPLTITHLPWQNTRPGTGECVATSGTGEVLRETTSYLSFVEGEGDNVDCGSGVSLADLPVAQMTVEAWIRTSNPTGAIVSKITFGPPDVGWWFSINPVTGELLAQVSVSPQSGVSVGNTPVSDGNWHHVLMTFDFGALILPSPSIFFAIDGIWETYQQQTPAAGLYSTDAAINLLIGNIIPTIFGLDGDISWVRINSGIVYDPANGNFIPEPRCSLPPVLPSTELLVIYEGTGATTIDLSGNGNNGTINGAVWGNDCNIIVGREQTCLDEVYVANKQNLAQLTHAFFYDVSTGTYSGNLIGNALPYNLYPAVPAVGDTLYIGIDTSEANSGPFNSSVFDIGTIQNDLVMSNGWLYWNGAWAALNEYDGTEEIISGVRDEPFTNDGVCSIHFEQETDWVTTTINGITGYWIKLEITAIGASPSPPTQQNRQIYTVTWSDIDVDDVQVRGDAQALSRIIARGRSGDPLVITTGAYTTRLHAALRSAYRGREFVMWLNASDEQNPVAISFSTSGGSVSIVNATEAPTGRATVYSPAASSVMSTRMYWVLDRSIVRDYFGRFNVFVRCDQTSGNAGDLSFRIRAGRAPIDSGWDSVTTVNVLNETDEWQLLKLGQIKIPSSRFLQREASGLIYISLQIANSNAGGASVKIYDIALMPSDEWTGLYYEVVEASQSILITINDARVLDMDSFGSPKDFVRALVRVGEYGANVFGGGAIAFENNGMFGHIGIDRQILMPNKDQRLYFIAEEYDLLEQSYKCYPYNSLSVRLEAIFRYLSMRGNS